MVLQTATQLVDKVKSVKEQRKNGDIDAKQFYKELLTILNNLTDSLVDELDTVDESEIRSQIPLIIVLLDDQIRAFSDRE